MTDELYPRAVASVIETQNGSTSRLQRALELGYNAACRLIERMEKEGIVSAPNLVGRREVLTTSIPPFDFAAAKPGTFQERVAPWMAATFGAVISGDREERNHRFLEESLELVQSNGCSASEAHQLVDYVFGRPVGDPLQEVGGVMVTLAALCLASGLDMHEAAETELTRVWTKVEAIRAKQAAKPKHSPLAERFAPPSDTSGYQLAFYELASLMNIGARAHAPAHVWRREMLPRLIAAFDVMPAEPSALVRSIAELEAFDRDGISLCEVENEVSFIESLSLCLHELKRLRALPPVPANSGEDHSCPACPIGPRDIGAMLHNLVGQLDRGGSILDARSIRKLASAKEALARWQPVVDAHFAALSPSVEVAAAVSSATLIGLLDDPGVAAAVNEKGGGRWA